MRGLQGERGLMDTNDQSEACTMAHRDLLPPDARITLDHLDQKPLSPGAACSCQAAVLQVLQATRRHNTQSRRDI